MTYLSQLDTDDIDALAAYIERRYPTEEIRFHDTEAIHFGYWDTSARIVSAMLLDHIQAAGAYSIRVSLPSHDGVHGALGWNVANTSQTKTT